MKDENNICFWFCFIQWLILLRVQSFLLAILQILLIRSSKESLLSIATPKTFWLLLCFSLTPSVQKAHSLWCVTTWNGSFMDSASYTCHRSSYIKKKSLVLDDKLPFLRLYCRHTYCYRRHIYQDYIIYIFKNLLNNKEPSIDSCGAPAIIFLQSQGYCLLFSTGSDLRGNYQKHQLHVALVSNILV